MAECSLESESPTTETLLVGSYCTHTYLLWLVVNLLFTYFNRRIYIYILTFIYIYTYIYTFIYTYAYIYIYNLRVFAITYIMLSFFIHLSLHMHRLVIACRINQKLSLAEKGGERKRERERERGIHKSYIHTYVRTYVHTCFLSTFIFIYMYNICILYGRAHGHHFSRQQNVRTMTCLIPLAFRRSAGRMS